MLKIQTSPSTRTNEFFIRSLKCPRLIKLLGFLLILSFFLFIFLQMERHQVPTETKNAYSVWGMPSKEVTERLKKLMANLRSEFGGPEFEPHVTVVGAIELTESDAISKFKSACEGVKAYNASAFSVSTGTDCVYVLLHPSDEVVEASEHCSKHFGYMWSTSYIPHMSLLYGDLTDEEKQKATERAEVLDATVSTLNFPISHLALYKTDTEDKTLKSWEKIADHELL